MLVVLLMVLVLLPDPLSVVEETFEALCAVTSPKSILSAMHKKQHDYQALSRSHRTSSAADQPWMLEHQPTFDPSARRWPSALEVAVVVEHSWISVVAMSCRWTSTLKAAAQEGLAVPVVAPVLRD